MLSFKLPPSTIDQQLKAMEKSLPSGDELHQMAVENGVMFTYSFVETTVTLLKTLITPTANGPVLNSPSKKCISEEDKSAPPIAKKTSCRRLARKEEPTIFNRTLEGNSPLWRDETMTPSYARTIPFFDGCFTLEDDQDKVLGFKRSPG